MHSLWVFRKTFNSRLIYFRSILYHLYG